MVRKLLEELTARQTAEQTAFNILAEDRLRNRFGAAMPSDIAGETPDERFERLWKRQQELREQFKGFSGADRLPREELYDRSKKW